MKKYWWSTNPLQNLERKEQFDVEIDRFWNIYIQKDK